MCHVQSLEKEFYLGALAPLILISPPSEYKRSTKWTKEIVKLFLAALKIESYYF